MQGVSTGFNFNKPSNASVGRRIGMTNSGVSRLRHGNRHPSGKVARLIEKEYDWPLIDQLNAMRAGNWAVEFNKVLNESDASA